MKYAFLIITVLRIMNLLKLVVISKEKKGKACAYRGRRS